MMTMNTYAGDRILNWEVRHPESGDWMVLGQKGSVQEMFIRQGLVPDPFYGLNEEKFGWFEEHIWEFRSKFELDSSDLAAGYIELDFASIDTYGTIYLNDQEVGKTKNAFIPHSFQVKDFVKQGTNILRVVITPPIKELGEMYDKADYHLPAPNDVNDTAVAPYTRKPQYQFGWDWSLRMNTIGFNDVAKIHVYSTNRIINKSVKTLTVQNGKAELEMNLFLAVDDPVEITWESELFGKEKIRPVDRIITRKVEIDNVNLWWPKGFGDQFIYRDTISIYSVDKQAIDKVGLNFGVKVSELIQEKDQWGTSYYFKVNGVPVFCKGADYIPQDVFPARITDESIREMVGIMAESNFNMVRVWGGGYYQNDSFYEECDRLGIMVWQDLMFACSMYPGDDAFLANVKEELGYQVPRIGGHPSIMLFNGNNEVEVAWENWGFQIKYGLYGKSAREIEKAYDDLFKGLAPDVVKKYTTIPYIHTSPLSNWGKMEYYDNGSQHYWGVWHGKDPLEDFGKKIGRFNAEYGFQSFPEFNTLATFSEESDWDISSDVMKQHQKSYVGNEMILKHAKRLYGAPCDFKGFVYLSQLTQAKAVSMAVAGHRVDAPRCGGTLYWQLNDCWPVSSWSSIDYYGNWKALQYSIVKDYSDLAVLRKYNDLEDSEYFLVSGLKDSVEVTLSYKIYDLKGKLIEENDIKQGIGNLEHKHIGIRKLERKRCRWFRKNKADSRVIHFSWSASNGENGERIFVELGDHKQADPDRIEVNLLSIDEKKKEALIEVTNKDFVADLWISSKKQGVRFSENFESYLPGRHLIKITYTTTPEIKDFELFWR